MVKRVVEPDSLDRVKLVIHFLINRILNNFKCQRITNICIRRIAMEVSGELIEQDYQSQTTSRCLLPFVQGTDASAG